MTSEHLKADEPFFSQWATRGKRSRTLSSAQALLDLLDFTPPPSLAVVGSKGKGTAAAAASMALAGSGLTTASITSPAFRTNRERIRIDGVAIAPDEYERLSLRPAALLPLLPTEHYLSPWGSYTVMGAWWGAAMGADVLGIEEGMGGATDEVSLFAHTALCVPPILMEHVGILGHDLGEIADNLLGAGSHSVQIVASAEQVPTVEALVTRSVDTWEATLVDPVYVSHRNPLVGENIGLGLAVGTAFAERCGKIAQDIPELNLPGRSSLHEGPSGRWFVDAAISPAGVSAALQSSPLIDPTIIASWPLSKDRAGCSDLVPDAIHVRVPGLDYPADLPTFGEIAHTLEGDVVVLGTISFIAQVLEHLKASTDLW